MCRPKSARENGGVRDVLAVVRSGRQDLNLRPPGPQPGALPDCATPRGGAILRRCGEERATGLEPVPRAWKAPVQPLTPRPRVTPMVAVARWAVRHEPHVTGRRSSVGTRPSRVRSGG